MTLRDELKAIQSAYVYVPIVEEEEESPLPTFEEIKQRCITEMRERAKYGCSTLGFKLNLYTIENEDEWKHYKAIWDLLLIWLQEEQISFEFTKGAHQSWVTGHHEWYGEDYHDTTFYIGIAWMGGIYHYGLEK